MEIERPKKKAKITKLPDFGIEYARSDRDECVGCQQKIPTSAIRIMHVVYDTDEITKIDGEATWYHSICFGRSRSKLGWLQSAEMLPGFKRLCEEDKIVVKNQIP